MFPFSKVHTLSVKDGDMSFVLLVDGYVVRKGIEKTTCASCKQLFGRLDFKFKYQHFTYFDNINRGEFLLPSCLLFNIFLV